MEKSQVIKFKDEKFRFEEDLEPNSTDNLVVWEFEGDPEDIVHIQPGCGCTANCRVDGNKLIAQYTDTESSKLDKDKITKAYPNLRYPFSKSVTVYLKDDEPLKILNDNGISVYNRNKEHVVLNFGGHISLQSVVNTD